jgi:heme/copper-type cytochrome/quinol oxidase subunit 2
MSPALSNVVFWIAAACCVVAQLALVWSAISSPMATASDTDVRMPRRASEIAWTIVPAVALVMLLFSTWRAMHRPAMTHDVPNAAVHQMIDD